MRGNPISFIPFVMSALVLSTFSAVVAGCGSPQEQETVVQPGTGTETETEPPSSPIDYYGRLEHMLRRDGIELDQIACNRNVIWSSQMSDDSQRFADDLDAFIGPNLPRRMRQNDREMLTEQVSGLAMNWFIRTLLIHGNYNNLGAVVLPSVTWTDDAGGTHPLVVFHTGTTPYASNEGSCFRSLISEGRVAHAINLYYGDVPLRDLIDAEIQVAEEMGTSYVDASRNDLGYRGWREPAGDEEATDEQRQEAALLVARLIRDQILQPGGNPPEGNIYFHCAGGMHRSPLISGVLRRCVAQETDSQVEEAMRLHAAYVDRDNLGGFELPILEFVREFDCSLLEGEPEPVADVAAEGGEAESTE